ncbi:SDR family NAD(P)-dependent oxidoreductase [Prescottella agglutinans]|uniref:NAD(P)-dependent dehydrogenase (Short-subunit alcohol dehydrogenase family) n=1 Tax=Prescottella agglutinans TaxID=1644129 RepID=A0ABT6MBL5_9NOCA|nr:SDR family oxidoreductase [Prescottella agglutinans]MDH6281181.1 NAD(P)-dependent dehydrogenase (short-subunit alcohol dehydrogenase family) [Prescottella agglutinans]
MSRAIVTGAGGAIGSAICQGLASRGHDIVAVDVDGAGLAALADTSPARITPHSCDLTAPGELAELVAAVGADCDLLVHVAGVVVTTPFEKVTAAEVDRELGVNLLAPVHLTRALYPALQESRGHVVAIVSIGGMLPLGESPGYSASKFGLRGFLLALAARTRETGVRVSIVNPGSVDTPMLRHEAATGGSALNFLSTPLTPQQIADRVLGLVDRPRVETNVPRADGWMVKTGMLMPGLTLRALPWIARLAQRNLRRYRERHGLVSVAD